MKFKNLFNVNWISNMLTAIYFVFISLINVSCNTNEDNPVDSTNTNSDLEIPGYNLVWNDEFEGTDIDLRKWEHEVNANGGGNNELQYYTARPENSFIENGKLNIVSIFEEYIGPEGKRFFTSARMRTKNKGDWKYGLFQIKAKLPQGKGTWPAIWMLPTNWEYGGWPESGEIDIMEHVGYDPGVIHASVHTKAFNHRIGTQKTAVKSIPDVMDNYHVYSCEWDEDKIDFFLDDVKYFTFSNENDGFEKWPFDKAFHIILNIAVGGDWGGAQGIDHTVFPQRMEFDWVRVYKKSE